MSSRITIRDDRGSGRPFVLLYDSAAYAAYAGELAEALHVSTRAITIESVQITHENWEELASELKQVLLERGLKHASFVSFEAACSLVQYLCLMEPKQVRTLVMVDPSSRPHPTKVEKLIDRLEHALPMGLPMRSRTKGFDSKAFLQRIRCPALIVSSTRASAFLRREASIISAHSPTAWSVALNQKDEIGQLSALVSEFQSIPAKCPQKNVASSA